MAETSASGSAPAIPEVEGLHHFAYRCRDARETRAFYEDLLGMPLVHVVIERDMKTTTGETLSFAHFFFQMHDGAYIAFFDLGDGRATNPDPETPAFVNHLALKVADEADLLAMKDRLEAAGHEVLGPMDHDGFVRSIYFWDPNGIRLEFALTVESEEEARASAAVAHDRLEEWVAGLGSADARPRSAASA